MISLLITAALFAAKWLFLSIAPVFTLGLLVLAIKKRKATPQAPAPTWRRAIYVGVVIGFIIGLTLGSQSLRVLFAIWDSPYELGLCGLALIFAEIANLVIPLKTAAEPPPPI